MKTLCITGISEPDLLQIGERFQQAGMAQPHSNGRNPGLNIKEWHDRFWGNTEKDVPNENRLLPGKFGEQLASEIFFANMETPLWGWHDSRTTWLLDFWADFDPRLVFLLVCFPLDYQLARIMEMETDNSSPLCVDEVVTVWKHSHEQLLQFYHRFPERCLLVDVDDCSTQFETLAQSCHEKWDLPLVVESEEAGNHFSSPDPLFRHLAKDFLNNQPEALSLWNELKATLTSFSSSTESASLQLSDVVTSLRVLHDRSSEHRQIAGLKKELESTFLQKQEAEKKWNTERDSLKKANADLTASRDKLAEQAKLAGERQTKLETVTVERDQVNKNAAELRRQLEALGKEKTKITDERNAKVKEIERLIQTRNAFKAEKDSLQKQLSSIKEQQRETTEENELLLLQLHQVQEELESIFLQKLEAEKNWNTEREQLKKSNADLAISLETQTEKTEARRQRLQQRHPGYHDYHSLTVAPGDKPSSLIWQISNLEIGSRCFQDLQFETFLLGGVSGFRFTRPGKETVSSTSPLFRWPLETQDTQQIDLIPVAENRQDVQHRVNTLKSLAASDWSLLQSLALFLNARLQDQEIAANLPAALRRDSMAGFDRFLEVIAKFPASLRYDRITLEQENCMEDCEQLQLSIENLSYGELQCPRFKFRLACAGLQSSDFGSHPRLEFPAGTSTVLKSWFDCSDNPEDPRLELRFAVPDAMDLDVWGKLSEEDGEFILKLVQHMPLMLEELRSSDSDLNRSWDQWLSLLCDMKQVLQLHTTPVEPEEAA